MPLIPDAAQSVEVGVATAVDRVTIVQTDVVSVTRIIRIACPKNTACAKGRPEGLKIIRITNPRCIVIHIVIAAAKIRDRYHPAPNGLTIVLRAPPVHFAAGFLVSPNAGNILRCVRDGHTLAIGRRFRAGITVLS